MNKDQVLNGCSEFLDSTPVRYKFDVSTDDAVLMIERDSIVQQYPAKQEEGSYKLLLDLLNKQFDESKARLFWSCKNDDYLFLGHFFLE